MSLSRVHAHVLVHTDPDHLDDTVNSLTDEPVDFSILPGIPRQVGFARALGFSGSSDHHDYVAFVDDGDIVQPGAFAEAIDYLDRHPGVVSVYSDVERIRFDGSHDGFARRPPWTPLRQLCFSGTVWHLHVMRRAAVMRCLDELARWPTCEEWVLMGLLTRFGIHHHVPKIWYRWRWVEGDSAGKQMTGELRRKAIEVFRPRLLELHRRGVRQA